MPFITETELRFPNWTRFSSNRKGLTAALDACAAGDVLTVWKLDRLGRSLLDLVGLVETLKRRNIGLKVLTGAGASIDTTKPEGRLFFAMFAAMAEFERELIRERTAAGMKAAKRHGVHVGRPRKLAPDQLDMATQLMADRSQRDVARALGVSTSTLREAMKQGTIRMSGVPAVDRKLPGDGVTRVPSEPDRLLRLPGPQPMPMLTRAPQRS